MTEDCSLLNVVASLSSVDVETKDEVLVIGIDENELDTTGMSGDRFRD